MSQSHPHPEALGGLGEAQSEGGSGHTRGPWMVSHVRVFHCEQCHLPDDDDDGYTAVLQVTAPWPAGRSPGARQVVAEMACGSVSNARLIAATPTMYDSLQSIVNMNATPETAWVALCEAKDRAQKAIARATEPKP